MQKWIWWRCRSSSSNLAHFIFYSTGNFDPTRDRKQQRGPGDLRYDKYTHPRALEGIGTVERSPALISCSPNGDDSLSKWCQGKSKDSHSDKGRRPASVRSIAVTTLSHRGGRVAWSNRTTARQIPHHSASTTPKNRGLKLSLNLRCERGVLHDELVLFRSLTLPWEIIVRTSWFWSPKGSEGSPSRRPPEAPLLPPASDEGA